MLENKVLDLYENQSLSIKEISQALGVGRRRIKSVLDQNGVAVKPSYEIRKVQLPSQDLLSKYNAGSTVKELSDEYGCSTAVVRKTLSKQGVRFGKPRSLHDDRESEIVNHYKESRSSRTTAKAMNCSTATVLKLARKHEMDVSSNSFHNKIDLDENVIIRLYTVENKNATEIANEYGCDYKTVCRLLRKHGLDIVGIREMGLNRSSKEDEVIAYLEKELDIKQIHTNNKIGKYEYDIALEDHNTLIEFNGVYWHSSEFKNRSYHKQKLDNATHHGYSLIQIWEHHWEHKRSIVESILRSRLGMNRNRFYARKLDIRQVSDADAKAFNDAYHIQGHLYSKINLGLYNGSELIMLMTYKNGEIARLCTKPDSYVIGGFKRLLKKLVDLEGIKELKSYCLSDYFDGSGYESAGFEFSGTTGPGYTYVNKSNLSDVRSRNSCQKHKLIETYGESLGNTESEIMSNLGYLKLFDSSNTIWKIKI